MTHWQAVLVSFTGGLPEKSKLPHFAGATPLHLFFHARVRHHQFPTVENIMADEIIYKPGHLAFEFGWFTIQLRKRLCQAMSDLHISPFKLAHQFHIVISRDAQGCALFHHLHRESKELGDFLTTIHQIAQENGLPALRRGNLVAVDGVSQLAEEGFQFVETTVYVADDVEGAMFVFEIVPQGLSLD